MSHARWHKGQLEEAIHRPETGHALQRVPEAPSLSGALDRSATSAMQRFH
jgi:hypothetical protein